MGSRLCPQCNSPLHPRAGKCPHCGAGQRVRRRRGPVRVPSSAKSNPNVIWMWVGLALAAVLVVISFLAFGESDRMRGERRMKRELQQQERNRAAPSPGDRR